MDIAEVKDMLVQMKAILKMLDLLTCAKVEAVIGYTKHRGKVFSDKYSEL